jgi:hypothetical protein
MRGATRPLNHTSSRHGYQLIIANFIFSLLSYNNNNNNNHSSTALYGLGLPLSEVTGSCAFVVVGDWPTGRAAVLSILMWPPEPSGRQSGDLGEKLELNFAYETFLFMGPTASLPLQRKWCSGFLSPLKIHRPRSGSNPRTLGPVASTLTTSPPRSTLLS